MGLYLNDFVQKSEWGISFSDPFPFIRANGTMLVIVSIQNWLFRSMNMTHAIVQAFISHATIEALYEPVLHWLSWRDVVPVNLPVLVPLKDRILRQFRAVVADHHAGI